MSQDSKAEKDKLALTVVETVEAEPLERFEVRDSGMLITGYRAEDGTVYIDTARKLLWYENIIHV